MKYGVVIFFTDYSSGPIEIGAALEERGFERAFPKKSGNFWR